MDIETTDKQKFLQEEFKYFDFESYKEFLETIEQVENHY